MIAAVGLLIGVAGAVLAGRSLEAQLFQTPATDPGTYVLVAFTLLVVTFFASAVPARPSLTWA